MHISIKQAFLGKSFLRVSALIIGYLLWSILGETYTSSIWLSVPLCFYNNNSTTKITAPEIVDVQLKGKRAALYCLDKKNLAVHINAQELKQGPNGYTITSDNLFLPPAIGLTCYKPNNLVITIS